MFDRSLNFIQIITFTSKLSIYFSSGYYIRKKHNLLESQNQNQLIIENNKFTRILPIIIGHLTTLALLQWSIQWKDFTKFWLSKQFTDTRFYQGTSFWIKFLTNYATTNLEFWSDLPCVAMENNLIWDFDKSYLEKLTKVVFLGGVFCQWWSPNKDLIKHIMVMLVLNTQMCNYWFFLTIRW